ncbi:MAG: cytochrome d ubiquinol oxidase subunit II [Polyangia bacterium]
MVAIWFAIVSVMIAVYVALDGFDLGAGALHRILARTEEERRILFAATGPLWDGNEVWLIAGGGALFCAFPAAYAAGFSGFYMPLMFVLWLLVLRGLSMELRNHHTALLWRSFWDSVLVLSCVLVVIVLGTAVGNVIRGVPLGADGTFCLPLFSSSEPAVLDRYTVSTGVLALLLLAQHGARFVAWKVDGTLQTRARLLARLLLYAAVPVLLGVSYATWRLRPDGVHALASRSWAWPLVAAVPMCLAAVLALGRKRRDLGAFLASGGLIVALLAATAAAIFPVLLHSTVSSSYDLDAYGAAASDHGLRVAFAWWCVGMPLVAVYFTVLFRTVRGKIAAPDDAHA